MPDIKSFSLPRAQYDLTTKINERYLEPANYRRTFKNGTLKSDFQWIQMKNMSDADKSETEKMHNYTNYQIVCMLQNIDDIAKDVLEIKEHIKKMHSGYNECLGIQNEHTQKLNDINSNMGIISRSLEHLRDALPQPTSPPHYGEVDLSCLKLKFSSSSDESKDGLRSILLKSIDNIDTAKIEKVQKGIMLAREKTDLMRERLTTFPIVESLRLPKGYVSLKTFEENAQPSAPQILAMSGVTSHVTKTSGEPTQGDSSSKRDRGDTFTFTHKGKKGDKDTFCT